MRLTSVLKTISVISGRLKGANKRMCAPDRWNSVCPLRIRKTFAFSGSQSLDTELETRAELSNILLLELAYFVVFSCILYK